MCVSDSHSAMYYQLGLSAFQGHACIIRAPTAHLAGMVHLHTMSSTLITVLYMSPKVGLLCERDSVSALH